MQNKYRPNTALLTVEMYIKFIFKSGKTIVFFQVHIMTENKSKKQFPFIRQKYFSVLIKTNFPSNLIITHKFPFVNNIIIHCIILFLNSYACIFVKIIDKHRHYSFHQCRKIIFKYALLRLAQLFDTCFF